MHNIWVDEEDHNNIDSLYKQNKIKKENKQMMSITIDLPKDVHK